MPVLSEFLYDLLVLFFHFDLYYGFRPGVVDEEKCYCQCDIGK